MIIHPAEQGTQGWLDARLGIPTASCFGKIITPKTLKLAEGRHVYKCELISEWLTGEDSSSGFINYAMERGTELEPKARIWYEITQGVEVKQVGICLSDAGDYGGSPDGLVGDDGGIEIKCPLVPGFVAYALGGAEAIKEHNMQVQGCLFVTGRAWWDVVIYHPKYGGTITRVLPEVATQEALAEKLPLFLAELQLAKTYLLEKGLTPFKVNA